MTCFLFMLGLLILTLIIWGLVYLLPDSFQVEAAIRDSIVKLQKDLEDLQIRCNILERETCPPDSYKSRLDYLSIEVAALHDRLDALKPRPLATVKSKRTRQYGPRNRK